MTENNYAPEVNKPSASSKTGLLISIIIILLIIVAILGIYAFKLSHPPAMTKSTSLTTVNMQQPTNKPMKTIALKTSHNAPHSKLATQTGPSHPHNIQDPFVQMQHQIQQMQANMDRMMAASMQQAQQAFITLKHNNGFMQESGLQLLDKKDHYIVTLNLPGVKKHQLSIKLTGQLLTVSGKVEHKTKSKHHQQQSYQRYVNEFSQTITLPEPVKDNAMQSTYKNGVLTIDIPKR